MSNSIPPTIRAQLEQIGGRRLVVFFEANAYFNPISTVCDMAVEVELLTEQQATTLKSFL